MDLVRKCVCKHSFISILLPPEERAVECFLPGSLPGPPDPLLNQEQLSVFFVSSLHFKSEAKLGLSFPFSGKLPLPAFDFF